VDGRAGGDPDRKDRGRPGRVEHTVESGAFGFGRAFSRAVHSDRRQSRARFAQVGPVALDPAGEDAAIAADELSAVCPEHGSGLSGNVAEMVRGAPASKITTFTTLAVCICPQNSCELSFAILYLDLVWKKEG